MDLFVIAAFIDTLMLNGIRNFLCWNIYFTDDLNIINYINIFKYALSTYTFLEMLLVVFDNQPH